MMETLFRSARKMRISEDVACQIEKAIAGGQIKPGQRLPAERVMINLFKVSRTTLRESLRMVEARGLLEFRRGRNGGAFVTTPAPADAFDAMDLMIRLHKLTLDDISDFRADMEGRVAAMAARKADDDDIRALNRLLDQAAALSHRGGRYMDRYLMADKALHLNIAKISGNPLYVHAVKTAHNVSAYFERYMDKGHGLMETNLSDLCRIVSAVSGHNPDAAMAVSMAHVRRFNAYRHDD